MIGAAINGIGGTIIAILLLVGGDKAGFWNVVTVSSIYIAAMLIIAEVRK